MFNYGLVFTVLFCIYFIIRRYVLKPSPADTPAGAIVMACGIFINGAMKNIKFLENNISELSAMLLLLLWIFTWASFGNSIIKGNAYELHFKNPIKSFAVGTWVAGTSVCGIAVFQRLPGLIFVSCFLFFIGLTIWLFYVGIIIKSYKSIFSNGLQNKVNGVLLLSTVSTQSLVVLGNTIFNKSYLIAASRFMISLGIVLYVTAFVLIVKRYFLTRSWSVEDDWQNTNCILHGAMSITGLASVTSAAIGSTLILIIWLWIIFWFVIVEAIEIIRALKRIKKYGFMQGIAIYDVTQWSRIFTFGMLYAFTMRFDLRNASYSNSILLSLQNLILKYGTVVMVFILIIEGVLFFKDEVVKRE
jgi:hypothetical protein